MKKFTDKKLFLIGVILIGVILVAVILGCVILGKDSPNDVSTQGSSEAVSEENISEIEGVYGTEIATEVSSEIVTEVEDETELVTEKDTEEVVVEKTYHLPVIQIETQNHQAIVEKDKKIAGHFSLDYNGTVKYANIDRASMTIKGRGHSTWKMEKKPYKIKFDEKISLFGLTEAKEWVLLANHADKSLIRNKLAMDVGAVLDNVLFTPHAYNVDVFVNGEYMGVYTLLEQIEVEEGRVPGEKDSTEVNTDYLLEMGSEGEATSFGTNVFHSLLYTFIEIKNPDSDVLSQEQHTYISNYVTEADRAVKALDNYETYIDIPSLIDWFFLNELSYNIDGTFRRSDYLLKQKDGKLYMATYWDYDYAFGNFWRDSQAFDEWICLGNENTIEDKYIGENWITFLLEDPAFRAQVKARWAEVSDAIYQTAMATINDAQVNVSASAERNFTRWPGVMGVKIQYENRNCANVATYQGQLDYLRDYIQKRFEWMDKTIKAL